jgi:MarR family transcriptional regulator, temperature-dependent positive regulator of motility
MFDDTPFHLMRVILQDHSARWARRMPDLTKPQYAILEALDVADGLGQTALGEASATTKGALTEILVRLEERGLIERRDDPSHGRKRTAHLTPAGRERLAAARVVAADIEEAMLGSFRPAEREALTTALAKLRHGVDATD